MAPSGDAHAGDGFESRVCLAACALYESLIFNLPEPKSASKGGRGELIFLPVLRVSEPRVLGPGFPAFVFQRPEPLGDGLLPLEAGLPMSNKLFLTTTFETASCVAALKPGPNLAYSHSALPDDQILCPWFQALDSIGLCPGQNSL